MVTDGRNIANPTKLSFGMTAFSPYQENSQFGYTVLQFTSVNTFIMCQLSPFMVDVNWILYSAHWFVDYT